MPSLGMPTTHATRLVAALVASALCVVCTVPVHGQARQERDATSTAQPGDLPDLGLEDLLNIKVYAASRFLQDVAQAPASVTIVGADEIRRHGYRSLADVLRGVRGFYVTYDRNYSYVGVRGFLRPGDYNGRILLLINGHRLNDTVFDQALLGTESPIDVSLLDRVEVIRGPSSSLYGTSAFFAVINLVTRQGRGLSGVEVETTLGSQQMTRGRVTAGGRHATGFEGIVSATAFRTIGNSRIGYPEFAGEEGGIALDADQDHGVNLFARGSKGGLTMQAGFGSRTKRVPTAPFDSVFNDPRTRTVDRRGFAEVHYQRQLDPRSRVELRGAVDQYSYDGEFGYETGLFHDDAHGLWLKSEGLAVRQYGAHAITAGAELRYNVRQDQSARDETGVLLDDRRRSQTAGLFLEDEFRISPRVLLNAGLRWDEYFGIFGGTVNPRVGLIVSPAQGSTVKALYGRAFRAPNPFELYYDQSALSAQLEPERIHTFEVALEQRLTPRLQVSGSVFRNRVHDLITQRSGSDETLDGLYYRNADSVTAQGVEVELQGELPGRVRARLSQVFQSARLDTTRQVISNSPRVLSTVVLDGPIPGTDAIVAFNGYVIGERRRVNEGRVAGAFVGNLSVSRRPPTRGLGASVTLYNVFGAEYGDPGSVEHRQAVLPQDGRTALARLSWRF